MSVLIVLGGFVRFCGNKAFIVVLLTKLLPLKAVAQISDVGRTYKQFFIPSFTAIFKNHGFITPGETT